MRSLTPGRWAAAGAAVLVLAGVVLLIALTGRAGPDGPPPLTASAGVAEVLGLTPTQTVTTFRGEPVTGAEVLRAAAELRAEVISRYGTRLGPGFWDRPRDGVTPRRQLREKAVGAAVLDKARRVWAREAGLIGDAGEQAFQRELREENARRAAAVAAGRPLPGVPEYDEFTYARVRAAELDSALGKLFAATLDLSEKRLRARYEQVATQGAPPYEQARAGVRQALIIEGYQKELRARAAA
ncbi:hypothetical protein OIE66_31920 [Nonomuraea sp. NBC_01738]|uniref:hypothetical protein n=1 Tax=Nonomuraea sp. NBC_01738 TaxID=2976003 RepID=UPI002E1290D1|nr:hypothetical protein OIE66_31920 [Nonomuraea sp. NBC_01738]